MPKYVLALFLLTVPGPLLAMGASLGPEMVPIGAQLGPEMVPIGAQLGPEMVPIGAQLGPEMVPIGLANAPEPQFDSPAGGPWISPIGLHP